jgi:DNA-binding transcriptional ArsR family regulator
MKDGPTIAPIGFLAGDPARANMLLALMSGKALTATELANEAGIAPSTASAHLAKLETGGLIAGVAQGRHKYFRLADHDVAELLEKMTGVAARAGHIRTRPGPSDVRIRKARVCYDHLAGEMGVDLMTALQAQAYLIDVDDKLDLTASGCAFLSVLGIDLERLSRARRPVCKSCLDWSQRRFHLAGGLGAEILRHIYAVGWAKPDTASRAVLFNRTGEQAFRRTFRLAAST